MDKDTRKNMTGKVITSLFIITISLLVVILVVSFFGMNVTTNHRNYTELSSDWVIQDGVAAKKTTLPGTISLTKPQKLQMSHKIPENVSDGDVLMVLAEHQNLLVSVDDFVIYEFESSGVLSDYCAKSYQFIPLNKDMAGKSITLIFKVSEDSSETHVALPVIGSSEAVFSYVFKNNFVFILLGGFLSLGGVVLMVTAAVMALTKKTSFAGKTALIGLFIHTVGMWQILETGMLQLLGEKESFTYLLSYACQMLMPVAIVWYFASKLDYRYRLLEFMSWLGMINAVVCTVLFILGVADLSVLSISTQLIIIISGVVLMYTLLTERLKLGQFKLTLPIFGSFIICVSGMLDITKLYVKGSDMLHSAGYIGFLLAAFVMLASFVQEIIISRKSL